MAIGRGRYAPPYVSTKGHSVLKQRSYGMPTRTPLNTGVSRASSAAYDTRAEEYFLADRVSNVNYLSNSALDDTYDTAKRSRGRDQQLLKEATNAIPRGSVRQTATVMSSISPLGPRRFPRRFGKPRFRSNQSASFYGTRLPGEVGNESTSDLMASARPAPMGSWQRYGRAHSASVGRSYLGDDDVSPTTSNYSSRASSVGPSLAPSSSSKLALLRSSSPASSLRSRQALPPYPMTNLSESKLLDSGASKPWGQSLSPSRSSYTPAPIHTEYEPPYMDSDLDSKPTLGSRRRRVLGSSRRSAGNYYERLLKKRGKKQGRFGPYYDVESIEGSDLSDVLSDVDSVDGTYDKDSDYESSSVSLSPYRHTYRAVSPSSPYYVDQDTEFVPFKPSRPLQTNGLLELSPNDDNDDNECSNSESLPSPTTDLSLSRYLPSSLVSAATSATTSTLPRLPYRSVVPYTSSVSGDSLAVPSSTPRHQLLDSLVSSSVQRAKSALSDLATPQYSGASLLLSVEGAGLSPEGKRVDFTYTPPPIPLYGRGLSLDSSVLGIRPSSSIKPIDKFISGYMDRMSNLKASLNDSLDKDRQRRLRYGMTTLDTGPRPSTSTTPSYTQSYEYVPVKHLGSQRLEQLPVTTFRRRQDDGRTERVDFFSLGEFRPRLSGSASRAITLPDTAKATGGYQLSVLDKINIKVSSESYATPQTSVASRRVARGRSLAPRAASVPPRSLKAEVDSTETSTTTATTAQARAKRPIVVLPAHGKTEDRATSVPPVVIYPDDKRQKVQAEPVSDQDGWRYRARATSVPPQAATSVRSPRYQAVERARQAPVQAAAQAPLPTADLRAHKIPRRFLTRSGMRTAFSNLYGYYQPEPKGRQANDDIRMSVTKARVLASPVAPATVARAKSPLVLPQPKLSPIQESLSDFPKVYVPSKGRKPSNRSKAAIIASKLEPDPIKRRRPRSEYAANKYRELRKEAQENTYGGSAQSQHGGLYASNVQRYTETRTTGTDDDDDKPREIMSWKYRLDSVLSPKDLLYQPTSLIRIREQLKNTQEKMHRHREMLDKYLDEGGEAGDVASSIRRRMAALEKRDPVIGGGADDLPLTSGVDASSPLSDLRRRIRRTLNKSRLS